MTSQEYELLYILEPDLSEEDQAQQNQRIRNQIEQAGGRIVSESIWGKRLLAYEIDKKREGIYVYLIVDMSGECTTQLVKFLQTESRVMRYIAVVITKAKRAEEARVAEMQEARRAEMEAEAARAAKRAAEAEAKAEESEEGSDEESEEEEPRRPRQMREEMTADDEDEEDDDDEDVDEDEDDEDEDEDEDDEDSDSDEEEDE